MPELVDIPIRVEYTKVNNPIIYIDKYNLRFSLRGSDWNFGSPWHRVTVTRKVHNTYKDYTVREWERFNCKISDITFPADVKKGVPKELFTYIRKNLQSLLDKNGEISDFKIDKINELFTTTLKMKVPKKRTKKNKKKRG